jgi:hypothetical protein
VSGILSIRKRIDYESAEITQLGGLLEFTVIAYEVNDENSYEQTQITVAIIDLNDNAPQFDSNDYNLTVNPKSTPGTSLTLINNNGDLMHVFDHDKVYYSYLYNINYYYNRNRQHAQVMRNTIHVIQLINFNRKNFF